MLNEALICAIILLSIPVGFWIAWLCRDELIVGRKWFKSIIVISAILGLFFLFYNPVFTLTFLFILISTFISYKKSFDKKWTRKRV